MIRSVAADGRPNLGGVFRPVDRPRVLDRIATAAQYRIATIIAPAGFGKTVAVRQFLATVSSSVVYDVPSDATTLVPFVRGFADALEEIVPTMRRSFATALDGARASETPGRDLATWAATHLRALDTLIVIDDLHVAEDDPEVSRFISALVDRTKNGPRWLFSSRSPLQLPVASWLAYGESDLVIDTVDLRFSIDEAKQNARAARLTVRDEELRSILDLVDGWPAALSFAIRTSTRASDLRSVSAGTREMVYRYLAEQVWGSLDDRVRAFLRTVAFLPRLDVHLAVAAGFDDAAAIIETLRERVAFITAIDSGEFKLHDLFREFVQRQVGLESDGALQTARVDAARVLEKIGQPGMALDGFIAARAVDEIERLLGFWNFALLESGHFDVVERALRVLPPALSTRPRVLALRAAIEDLQGRADQAQRWYAAVLESADEELSFRVAVAWRYSLSLYQQSRTDAIPLLSDFYQREDLAAPDRAQVAGALAMSLALAGQQAQANATIEEALRLAEFADDELRARTYGRAATVAFFGGDADAVERFTRDATRLATECGAFALAARLFSALVAQSGADGRIPAMAWYASQVSSNAEKGGDPHMRALGLRMQLECEALRGNADRIAAVEAELTTLNYRGTSGLSGLITGRVIVALGNHAIQDAHNAASVVADGVLDPHLDEVRLALFALTCAAADDRRGADSALARIAESSASARESLRARDRAFAERYVALAQVRLGRNTAAQRTLRGAQQAGEDFAAIDATIVAAVNRSAEQFENALRRVRLAGLSGLARMIDATIGVLLAADENTGVSLTAVETQVLASMATGLSNQAIADEQNRTINTVRTHVSSILRKLACESRGEAVAAARRQNLI